MTHPDSSPFLLLASAIATISLIALASALVAEYVFELLPCNLCIYQRIPYALSALLGLFAVARPQNAKILLTLAGVAFLGESALAFYHVGVQQHWWASVAGCGGQVLTATSPAEMLAQLQGPKTKPCDQVDVALFGISLAGYNALMAGFLGIATLWSTRRIKAGTRG